MKINNIEQDGVLLAKYIKLDGEWPLGLSFYSEHDDSVQVGLWNHECGHSSIPHKHNNVPRSLLRTQEVVYVVEGRLLVRLFDLSNKNVSEFEMGSGDLLVLLNGGHSFTVAEHNTKVIEIKNGPYLGADIDRTRFEP